MHDGAYAHDLQMLNACVTPGCYRIMGCDDLSFITKKCGSLSLSPKKGMEVKVCSTSHLEVQHLMIPNLSS
jgi:hypothetical protein